MSWKAALRRDPLGFYRWRTERGELRLFLTPELLAEMEDSLGAQMLNARAFPGVLDAEGRPTCSYKGGDPGFVRALDERTLAFPLYDGNGTFLSAGNVPVNGTDPEPSVEPEST